MLVSSLCGYLPPAFLMSIFTDATGGCPVNGIGTLTKEKRINQQSTASIPQGVSRERERVAEDLSWKMSSHTSRV